MAGQDEVLYVCVNNCTVLEAFNGCCKVTLGVPSPKITLYVVPAELLNQLPITNSTGAGMHKPVVDAEVVKLAKGFNPL